MGFGGQAAHWLFEDLKSTWIYASFTSTVLTARALCMLQLANSIRLSSDDATLPEEAAATLEEREPRLQSSGISLISNCRHCSSFCTIDIVRMLGRIFTNIRRRLEEHLSGVRRRR